MTSYVPPKKNDANGYVFYVSLAPRTANGTWQANPTLASGDAKIAIDDGAPANLNTLPAVDADFTKRVKVVLSQAETNGDNLTIIFSDASGGEWCDLTINLQTAAQTLDEMDVNIDDIETIVGTTGVKLADDAITSSKYDESTAFPITANPLVVDASGAANANITKIANSAVSTSTAQLGVNVVNAGGTAWNSGAVTSATFAAGAINAAAIAADAIGASELASDAVTEIISGVWAAASRTLTALDEDDTTIDIDGVIQAANDARFDSIDSALTTIDGVVDAIVADTNELQTDWADGGRLDLILDARASQSSVDDLPTNSELATAIAGLNDIAVADILAAAYEGSETVQDFLRIARSALYGEVSGAATTTMRFRDAADSKDRIVATVDADGNRSALTLDAS